MFGALVVFSLLGNLIAITWAGESPSMVLPTVTPLNFSLPLPGLGRLNSLVGSSANPAGTPAVPCTCGVFLSGQFAPGSRKQPDGPPPLIQEYEQPFPCSSIGNRQCANKCLEVIAKHLRNSATIVCGSLDRDCFKERAYLFTKNCNDVWENSNMSAGREFCCKDGEPYKCPIGNKKP